MTLFGVIWILVLSVIFFRKNNFAAIGITLFSMVLQCNNVILIENKGVGPQIITSAFFIIYSCYYATKRKSSEKYFKNLTFLLFIIIGYSLLFEQSNLYGQGSYLGILQLFIYTLCGYKLYKCRDWIDSQGYLNIFLCILLFELVLGPIQLLSTIGIIPKSLLRPFIYNDPNEMVYFNREVYYFRILGSFMEPSYFSTYLVGAFYFILAIKTKIKHYKIYAIISMVELALTFSSTGYLIFTTMFFVNLLLYNDRKQIKLYILILIIGSLFVYYAWDTLMQEVIFKKMESGSGIVRMQANNYALSAFQNNHITGVGYGNCRGSSMIYTILAELGILGISIYGIWLLYTLKPLITIHKNGEFMNGSLLYILTITLGQIIACPDISLCTLWLGIYFLALSQSYLNRKLVKE